MTIKAKHFQVIESVIHGFLQKISKRNELSVGDLARNWTSVLPEYARACRPLSLRRLGSQRQLTIQILEPAMATVLMHQTFTLLARINEFYGVETIHKILFKK